MCRGNRGAANRSRRRRPCSSSLLARRRPEPRNGKREQSGQGAKGHVSQALTSTLASPSRGDERFPAGAVARHVASPFCQGNRAQTSGRSRFDPSPHQVSPSPWHGASGLASASQHLLRHGCHAVFRRQPARSRELITHSQAHPAKIRES